MRPTAAALHDATPSNSAGRRIVADRDSENRHGDVRGLNDYPRTAPAGPHIPTTLGEGPVLVGVEEDVGRSARSIVDGALRDHDERRRGRELDTDVDAHAHLGMSGNSNRGRKQRYKD